MVRFLRLYLRLQLWNVLPNRRGAHFFDLWSGRRRTETFRRALHDDLAELFGLLADGTAHRTRRLHLPAHRGRAQPFVAPRPAASPGRSS